MASWVSSSGLSSASPVAAHSSLRRSTSGFNGRFRRSVPRCAAKLTQDVDVVQHVVVRGDTLGKIASTYGVEPGNLVGAKATLSTGKARTIGSDGTVLLGHNASKALNGATKVDQSGQNGVASSEQQLSKNGEKAA